MKMINLLTHGQQKTDLPELKPGFTVRIHQKIKEGEKERVQIFEGVIIALKHGAGIGGMMTVRKIAEGVGVEKIFPIHSPSIEKIDVIRKAKVRRAKLYFLRGRSSKKTKAKMRELVETTNAVEPIANIPETKDEEKK